MVDWNIEVGALFLVKRIGKKVFKLDYFDQQRAKSIYPGRYRENELIGGVSDKEEKGSRVSLEEIKNSIDRYTTLVMVINETQAHTNLRKNNYNKFFNY